MVTSAIHLPSRPSIKVLVVSAWLHRHSAVTWRRAECSLTCVLQALERTLFFLCAMTQHQGDWQLTLPGNPLEVRRACIAFLGWAKQPRAGELLPITKAEKVG